MMYIRAEASRTIGYGHLKRCLSIAAALRRQGESSVFLCASDDDLGQSLIKAHGFDIATIAPAADYAAELGDYPKDGQTIIMDLLHVHNTHAQEKLEQYVNALKAQDYKVAMIDGAFGDAYHPAPQTAPPDLLIQPYVGVQEAMAAPARQWIGGAQYAIMDARYKNLPAKTIRDRPEKILLTFGGSDPHGLTRRLMPILARSDFETVRVVIGPYFSEADQDAIRRIEGPFELLEDVRDMSPHYDWADMAVTASGLSRYECAAHGLPAVFAALYPSHIESSRAFEAAGLARYVGLYSDVADDVWQDAINDLAGSPEKRRDMSTRGQDLIDGKGAERLADEIRKAFA